jgi:hypothetical protein
MQILLMNTSESTQVGPKCSPCSLAGIAMDLALAISMIIPRPFAHTMGNRGMAWMAAAITLPFVGIKSGAALGHVVGNEAVAGLPTRVITDL